MKLTKAQQKLVDDAKANGYTVELGDTDVDIYKHCLGRVTRGIRLCENGKAYRLDIPLVDTTWINTQKDMRQYLDLILN